MAGTDSESSASGSTPRIVQTDDVLGGEPRIEGRRVGVYHVYERYVEVGETAESIATTYDLDLGAVHAALAYAFSNPEEMREIATRHQERYEDASDRRLTPDEDG